MSPVPDHVLVNASNAYPRFFKNANEYGKSLLVTLTVRVVVVAFIVVSPQSVVAFASGAPHTRLADTIDPF